MSINMKQQGDIAMSMDSRICAPCAREDYLYLLISNSPVTDQECEFCKVTRPTVSVDELSDRCERVLEIFYEPTSVSEDALVNGREPEGEPLKEVLDDLLKANEDVVDAVVETLSDRWFDLSSHEHKYGEDPYFARRSKSTYPSEYSADWKEMEHSLRNEARLFNPKVQATLEKVFRPIHRHRTWRGGIPVAILGPGTEVKSLYRARVFFDPSGLHKALSHPARELGPPPPGVGSAGRMNAQGVSAFYGATTPQITIAEVRPPVGSYVLVGRFKLTRSLSVLDLDKLEELVVGSQVSYFDPRTVDLVAQIHFLRSLSASLVVPVMPGQESGGYLVTQAIADFLATDPHLNLDGILFKSVQYGGDPAEAGRNVVLFNKASRVDESDSDATNVNTVHLFEEDEDGRYFEPSIYLGSHPEPSPGRQRIEPDTRVVTLQIELDHLSVSEVKGVAFQTNDKRVYVHAMPVAQLPALDDF
jgi:hypothetical protein